MSSESLAVVATTVATRVVARDPIIAELLQCAFDGVGALITAPAGVGKSRVLFELVRRVRLAGQDVAYLTGSEAGRVLPYGLFLDLIPPQFALGDATSVAMRIRSQLRQILPQVIAVDDAQEIDAASAGLLRELAVGGRVVLMAARSGSALHEALTGLWRSSLIRRFELEEFDRVGVRAVAESYLEGPVNPGLALALFRRTHGNALALRELLREALRLGAIESRHGLWTTVEDLPAIPQLDELLRIRLSSVPPALRAVLDLIAVVEAIRLSTAELMTSSGEVAAAEAAQWLHLDDGEDPIVRMAHPLLREAVLTSIPATRRRTLVARLVDESIRAPGDIERVQLARWLLELGRPVLEREVLSLADLVVSADPNLSMRLLQQCVTQGGSDIARLRLAEVMAHQHLVDEAEAVLDEVG
ncbi:MAG: hypothetical protein ABI632_10955, partial [Pseudolysinimonas sp.]